jgi:hypothetical protein
MRPEYKLIHFFTTTAAACHHWDDSPGKSRLWDIIMTILLDLRPFAKKGEGLDLLSYHPILFKCSFGIAVYTISEMQVNVHLVMPEVDHVLLQLLERTTNYLCAIHVGCAMNLNPIKDHTSILDGDCFARRRFVPDAKYIVHIELIDDKMIRCLNDVQPLFHTVANPHDLIKYKPITRMKMQDDKKTLYWHRFKNGLIGVFYNPFMSEVVPVPFPSPIAKDDTDVYTHIDSSLHPFIKSLYPDTIEQTAQTLSSVWIPQHLREYSVLAGKVKHGMSDDFVKMVGTHHRDIDEAQTTLVQDILSMYRIMSMESRLSDICIADDLCMCLKTCSDQVTWRKWMRTSSFLMKFLQRVSKRVVVSMCNRFPPFLLALMELLSKRIGEWTRDDMAKSYILKTSTALKLLSHEPLLDEIHDEMERVNEVADTMARLLSMEILPTSKQKTKRQTSFILRSDDNELRADMLHVATRVQPGRKNHIPLLEKIRSMYPFHFDLIGSGFFTDEGDVDLVITVTDGVTSLQEAYQLVIDKTGWIPCYTSITGEHVAILVGEVDGVSIDAQIWRGDKYEHLSKSEELTRNALELSERLLCEVDTSTEEHIRWLHSWSVASSMKGHCFCRLPGVAVTTIAITIGCQTSGGSSSMLKELYDRMTCPAPYFNLDGPLNEAVLVKERCVVPLIVVVNNDNCATRMTIATTRHMLDTLAFTLTLHRDLQMQKEVYHTWRRRTMIRCARLQPRTDSSVSHTLHIVANSLSGHPYIDTLFFEQEPFGCILVLCTLLKDANVKHYGFRPDDHILLGKPEDDYITVQRNSRSMKLMLSPRDATTDSFRSARSLHDMILKDERFSFPNAPGLSLDVIGRFDTRFWKCVW